MRHLVTYKCSNCAKLEYSEIPEEEYPPMTQTHSSCDNGKIGLLYPVCTEEIEEEMKPSIKFMMKSLITILRNTELCSSSKCCSVKCADCLFSRTHIEQRSQFIKYLEGLPYDK